LEKVIREIDVNQPGFKLQELFIGILVYTDDVMLLERLQGKLKDMFLKLKKSAANIRLQCNEKKTAYMMVKRRESFVTILSNGKYISTELNISNISKQ